MTQNLPAWMVEASYRYLCAAKWLLRGHDLMDVAQINAALGVEIILKSFIAKPNGNHGEVNQTYKIHDKPLDSAHQLLKCLGKVSADKKYPDRHDLLTLFYAVPEHISSAIDLCRHAEQLERCRHVFTGSRYSYEKTSPPGYDTTLIEILEDLIPRVVEYHRSLGSKDLFIRTFGLPEITVDPEKQRNHNWDE